MEYSKLVAVTGLPGLYELISSKNDGAIVRSLDDNSTKFASSRIHNFSHLESIEIFTTGENVNLVEIFYAMEKAGSDLPNGKDNGVLKKYFEKVYPDLDFERVYASDLKKMVKWFDILKKNKVEIKLSEPVEEEEPEEEKKEIKVKPPKSAEPAKEPAKKPAAKEVKETKAAKEEKPKPAAKKAAAEKEKPKPAAKKAEPKKTEKKAAPKAAKKSASPKKKK
ncbi:MAG: DUF5606 domain-containing protein [Chitinophagaceae bacterium]